MPGTPAPPLVLSIQSHVAYGHVGNDAAMLPLLGARGLKVSVIKHSHHDFEMEPPAKDSPPM